MPRYAYAISVLGRVQSNPGMDYSSASKKVMRYLQINKHFKLVFRNYQELEIVGYTDISQRSVIMKALAL